MTDLTRRTEPVTGASPAAARRARRARPSRRASGRQAGAEHLSLSGRQLRGRPRSMTASDIARSMRNSSATPTMPKCAGRCPTHSCRRRSSLRHEGVGHLAAHFRVIGMANELLVDRAIPHAVIERGHLEFADAIAIDARRLPAGRGRGGLRGRGARRGRKRSAGEQIAAGEITSTAPVSGRAVVQATNSAPHHSQN